MKFNFNYFFLFFYIVRRPNIGCRELVQREMSKYLPGIVNELTDWKVDIRVKSAQLLCTTCQHTERKLLRIFLKYYHQCIKLSVMKIDELLKMYDVFLCYRNIIIKYRRNSTTVFSLRLRKVKRN